MGRTVINETENKQTIILDDSAEGISGGFFDANMAWHTLSSESAFNFTGKEGGVFGGMAKALITGNFSSGTFTAGLYTNDWQTFLDTGRSDLNGIMMWDKDSFHAVSGSATGQFITIVKREDNNLTIAALDTPTNDTVASDQMGTVVLNYEPETLSDKRGIQGYYRINGGVIEYKGRYNKNALYQTVIPDTTWEWIAW